MRLFYDSEGNIVGSYESEIPGVEQVATIEGYGYINVPSGELSHHPHEYRFINGQLVHRDLLKADHESRKPGRKKKQS